MKYWFPLTLLLICGAQGFAGTAHAEDSVRVQAREHFKQGVALFDERRFGDALAQFERSYSLFPAYSTLYNVGQVQVALGHPVQAVEAFEKYLVQGGASIPADQRIQVEAELKAQRQRIGDIKFAVSPDGAELRIDGDRVGKAPMSSPVNVVAGHHRVEVMLDGYRMEQREIDVAGQGHVELQLKLEALAQVGPLLAPLPPPAPAPTTPAPAAPANAFAPTAPPAPASPIIATARPTTPSGGGTALKVFGYLFTTAGLVGAGVGAAFAIDGQNKHDDALEQWTAGQKDVARVTEQDSQNEKKRGFVIMGVGGGVALTGVIMLIAAPSSQPSQGRVHFAPWIGVNTGGASVEGRF
jgi:hypothetical protein